MSKRGRHTSLDKSLKTEIQWLEAHDIVERLIIGRSETCRHAYPPGHLKIQGEVQGGFRINGYSGFGVTQIFIKVADANKAALLELLARRTAR